MSYDISNLIAHINVYVYAVSGIDGVSREGVRNVMDNVGVCQPDMDLVTERMDAVFNLTRSEAISAMAGVVLIRSYLNDELIEEDDWS